MAEDLDELVRDAGAGDSKALKRLAGLVAGGNLEALKALKALVGGTKEEEREEAADPAAFRADLLRLKDLASSKPGLYADEIQALARRARRLGSCEQVQLLGLEARRLMTIGVLDEAGERLAKAKALEGLCRDGQACALEIRRWQALLARYRGQLAAALSAIEGVLASFVEHGGAGHDLNGDGLASTLIARGQIRFHLGDFDGSAEDHAAALGRFRPLSKVWSRTQLNLASSLVQAGPAGRRRVVDGDEFAALRLAMRRRGDSVERAAFLWLDGQLWLDQAKRPRCRGFERLKAAMRIYTAPEISTPDAFLNVVSDIVQGMTSDRYPDRGKIAAFLEEEAGPLAIRVVTHDLHHKRLRELYARCRARPTAAVWLEVRAAVEALRASAERSLPCLLGWPHWLATAS